MSTEASVRGDTSSEATKTANHPTTQGFQVTLGPDSVLEGLQEADDRHIIPNSLLLITGKKLHEHEHRVMANVTLS